MTNYKLSLLAESDLISIADYTIYKFGIEQARRYRDGILETIEHLSAKPRLGRTFALLSQNKVKRYRYKSHVIFYEETIYGLLIVRILGGKMDFKRHF